MSTKGWKHFCDFWVYSTDLAVNKLTYTLDAVESTTVKSTVNQTELVNKSSNAQSQQISFDYTASELLEWKYDIPADMLLSDSAQVAAPKLSNGVWIEPALPTYNIMKQPKTLNNKERKYDSRSSYGDQGHLLPARDHAQDSVHYAAGVQVHGLG